MTYHNKGDTSCCASIRVYVHVSVLQCAYIRVYVDVSVLQSLNDDITSQKGKARDVISACKRLRRESSSSEDPLLKDKMDELKHEADLVSKLSADRMSILEQVVPLAAHLSETHSDLLSWFDEIEAEMKTPEMSAINLDHLKEQQDVMKVSIFTVYVCT